ncbi:MAG: glycosyltransferase [Alphaproteobacteria bacterium]|nr:glycosyltransferase [Alphaproteobacteria bacterium]
MKNRKVFIGMRTHNSSDTVSKSLKSVLQQEYKNIHIVIYGDKSTDNTLSLVNIYKNMFAQKGIQMDVVSGEQQNNEGCGKASERLSKIVASQIGDNDIYMGLDSDDVFLTPNIVENCVEQMNKTKANILIAGYDI